MLPKQLSQTFCFIFLVPQVLNLLPVTTTLRLMLSRKNDLSFRSSPPHLKIFALSLLPPPPTSEKFPASLFLISLQTSLLQLYLSTLTASMSPSPLVPPFLSLRMLTDFKTTFLDHDKVKTIITCLSPPTLLPNLSEDRAVNLPSFLISCQHYAYYSKTISNHHILIPQCS